MKPELIQGVDAEARFFAIGERRAENCLRRRSEATRTKTNTPSSLNSGSNPKLHFADWNTATALGTMADLRQRSIKEDLKSETKAKRAQSILIYGEQRYEYAKDVPYRTQMAANYA